MQQPKLKSKRRQAFVQGFWRGLASPFDLYAGDRPPTSIDPKAVDVQNPAAQSDGLRGDWSRVGMQLRKAMSTEFSGRG